MPTVPYFNSAGQRLPGVTTVNGNIGWNRDALMYYAWKKGTEGKDFRDYTKNSADIGTLAHGMVEAHVRGIEFVPELPCTEEQLAAARVSFGAYERWARQSQLQIIATEVYMVSEQYQYGGCLDAVGLIDGELSLIDWKTSNGVYADHIIQLCAYKHLWEEVTEMPLTGGYHLCRFAKDTGGFTHHWWPADTFEEHAWPTFTWARALHQKKWIIEKLTK